MKKILTLLLLYSQLTLASPGVIVIAGGGPEGELDEKEAWSYPLYKRLIDNGSIHGNKQIKAVVVSLDVPSTTFISDYLIKIGATSAHNITVDSKAAANNPKIVDVLADADVVFFRGGNQGEAYQFWKDSLLQRHIKSIADKGGAIGGTSSGSMGLSEYSMTGGQDFNSFDLLKDSKSDLLNDEIEMSKSGIHNDFLNLIPGAIVDTHCGERARLGRLLAVHAKASEDYDKKDILAICLEEKTGIAISNGKAEVYGTGVAHFIQQTPDSEIVREKGKPLIYTNVRDDALTEKWIFDFSNKLPITNEAPASAESISQSGECGGISKNANISKKKSNSQIQYSVDPSKKTFKIIKHKKAAVKNVIAIYDGHSEKYRSENQTNTLRALFDLPNASALILPVSSVIEAKAESDQISFNPNSQKQADISTLIFDCSQCSQKSLSSFVSNQDSGTNTLHSAGFVNLRIHALASGYNYNVRTHQILRKISPTLLNNESQCLTMKTNFSIPLADQVSTVLKEIEICNP